LTLYSRMDLVVKKIQAGDLKEFERLFKDLYSPLCSYANRIIRDKDKAEEIVQDIFYTIWKNRANLEIKVSLKSYLYRAVHNNCLQTIEHYVVEEKYIQYIKNGDMQPEPDPLHEMELKEMNKVIDDTIEGLPERCRQIFRMNRFDGLKYREIAEILRISIKTVEADMGKALQAFRQNLKIYAE
jgi:RNA polymerase sigma-70 factor, ECF subfamily